MEAKRKNKRPRASDDDAEGGSDDDTMPAKMVLSPSRRVFEDTLAKGVIEVLGDNDSAHEIAALVGATRKIDIQKDLQDTGCFASMKHTYFPSREVFQMIAADQKRPQKQGGFGFSYVSLLHVMFSHNGFQQKQRGPRNTRILRPER